MFHKNLINLNMIIKRYYQLNKIFFSLQQNNLKVEKSKFKKLKILKLLLLTLCLKLNLFSKKT